MIFRVNVVVDCDCSITLLVQQRLDDIIYLGEVSFPIRRRCIGRRQSGLELLYVGVWSLPSARPAIGSVELSVGRVPVKSEEVNE